MRNLKKVLALVLAMAMSLSLAVTAGAAFNDQDKIVNTEAVDMCVALNIINGRTNGSFDPAGNVTRAEMAKMICIVLNGGKEPTTATKAVPTFADIDGHWAEGYIEYCFAKGVVAGKSATEFAPNAGVTGTEAAKMLLVALGYNAEVEKMVGANWALYTNVLANQTGLYEELESMDPGVALSRDNAAQMIWNTLKAVEIIRSSSIDREDGSINDSYLPGTETLLAAKYGVTDDEYGQMMGFTYSETKGQFTYYFQNSNGSNLSVKQFVTEADYTDLYLQMVKVVYKAADDVMGMYAYKSGVVVEAVVDQIEEADEADELTIAGTDYELDKAAASINVYEFVYGAAEKYADLKTTSFDRVSAATKVVAIDTDDNDKINFFVVYPFSVEKVTYVGTKGITAGVGNTLTFEDDTIYEGVAKDDYVVITKAANTTDGQADVVEKAELTTIKVTGSKTGSVQVDGAWYTNEAGALTVGEEYDVVMINDVILAAEPVDTNSKDVLFVSAAKEELNEEFDSDSVSQDVKAWFTDGKGEVITVSKVAGNDVSDENTVGTNALYTYKVVDGAYELTAVSDTNEAGYDDYITAEGAQYNNKKLAATRVADDAVIFVVDGTDVEVITGAALKDWGDTTYGTSAAVLANESNGVNYAKVGFVVGADGTPDALSDILYGFVTAEPWETTVEDDGDDVAVVAIQVWTGSETTTLNVKGTLETADLNGVEKGDAISYKVDGLYVAEDDDDSILAVCDVDVAITGFEYVAEGDVVYYAADEVPTTTALDEDVVFIGINTDNVDACEAITMADIQLAMSKTDGAVAANAYVVTKTVDDVTTIVAIFMDINNELEGGVEFVK